MVGGVFVVLVSILAIWSHIDTNDGTAMNIDAEEAREAQEDAAEGKPPEPEHIQTPEEKAAEEEYFEES